MKTSPRPPLAALLLTAAGVSLYMGVDRVALASCLALERLWPVLKTVADGLGRVPYIREDELAQADPDAAPLPLDRHQHVLDVDLTGGGDRIATLNVRHRASGGRWRHPIELDLGRIDLR